MSFSSGSRTNEANLSMRIDRNMHFDKNYKVKGHFYSINTDALNLKTASTEEIAKNRYDLRCEVVRTNLLRYTIAMFVIFWVLLTMINLF